MGVNAVMPSRGDAAPSRHPYHTSLQEIRKPWSIRHDQTFPVPLFQDRLRVIRVAVKVYVWCQLSLRNVENLLHECGVDISHETVWFRGQSLSRRY